MTNNNDEVPQTMILQGKQSMKKKTVIKYARRWKIFQANENDLHPQQRSRFSSCAGPVKTQTSQTIYFLPSAA